jgi:hypothetical protein
MLLELSELIFLKDSLKSSFFPNFNAIPTLGFKRFEVKISPTRLWLDRPNMLAQFLFVANIK